MIGRGELLQARPDLASELPSLDAAFPVRITRSFARRGDLSDPDDPLMRQVVPDPRELSADEGDLADPVGEGRVSPLPWVIHKHADRVLLLTTRRCHLYCRYCFRRGDPHEPLDPTADEIDAMVDYVHASGATEVILSGGDPLILRDAQLFSLIDRLMERPLTVRVHTRAPITFPERVTDTLVAGLRARAPVWVLVHCNHPRELSPDVDGALARLVDGGIPVLNQAVLLAGVNDRVDVLADLSEALVARRVFPYYLHHTDRVAGNAHLRVDPERGRELYAALRGRVSGVACPRYVVDLPDGSGKVDAMGHLAGSTT